MGVIVPVKCMTIGDAILANWLTRYQNIVYPSSVKYSPLEPLSEKDPALTLEPSPTAATTETTRFDLRYLIFYNSSTTSLAVKVLRVIGILHIYVNIEIATYYYKLYASIEKTTNFSTFTTLWGETVIASYSRGSNPTSGWYDEYSFDFYAYTNAVINPGEAAILRLRGTSYATAIVNNSIGLKTSNTKIFILIG